jgi:hypothetical protein
MGNFFVGSTLWKISVEKRSRGLFTIMSMIIVGRKIAHWFGLGWVHSGYSL